MRSAHDSAAQRRDVLAEKRLVAAQTLNEILIESGEGLLTEDEHHGLVAALPRLGDLCVDMRVANKPIGEWSKEEIMRFLTIAVRAAVPLRVMAFTLTTDEGKAPF